MDDKGTYNDNDHRMEWTIADIMASLMVHYQFGFIGIFYTYKIEVH